jgi:hypothetical protein
MSKVKAERSVREDDRWDPQCPKFGCDGFLFASRGGITCTKGHGGIVTREQFAQMWTEQKSWCPHNQVEIRVRKYDDEGEPTHVARQCVDCYAIIKVPGSPGYWLPRREWPVILLDWLGGKSPF